MTPDPWQRVLTAFDQSAAGLVAANAGLMAMNEALNAAVRAASEAHGEHEDLRDTVQRVERHVMQLLEWSKGGTR